jgi:ribosome maturation factor RimP
MIPKKIVNELIDVDVYIYIKNISEKFSGTLTRITEDDLVVLKDKYNNNTYIPLSEIDVITERR